DARSVLRAAVAQLTSERTRQIDQRIIAGDPASALLNAAGNDPANLIVVGNSGLGAAEGHRLGSVPTNVVRNASCDVLIVQPQKGATKPWSKNLTSKTLGRFPPSVTTRELLQASRLEAIKKPPKAKDFMNTFYPVSPEANAHLAQIEPKVFDCL